MRLGIMALNGQCQATNQVSSKVQALSDGFDSSYILGVDGGSNYLFELGLTPDEIIGDFDSLNNLEELKRKWPKVKIDQYPSQKNYTDSELAIGTLIEKSVDRIIVIGAFGGRIDHMVGSMYLMNKVPNKIEVFFVDAWNVVTWFEGPIARNFKRAKWMGKYFSIIPVSESVKGINLKGFKYPLVNASINMGDTIGISNEASEPNFQVEIQMGKGFLMFTSDEIIC